MADDFQTNLLRVQFAATWFSVSLQAGREMFGKSYLSLSPAEKAAVDHIVQGALVGNYAAITPEWLAAQKAPEVGFHVPEQTARPSPSPAPKASKK